MPPPSNIMEVKKKDLQQGSKYNFNKSKSLSCINYNCSSRHIPMAVIQLSDLILLSQAFRNHTANTHSTSYVIYPTVLLFHALEARIVSVWRTNPAEIKSKYIDK